MEYLHVGSKREMYNSVLDNYFSYAAGDSLWWKCMDEVSVALERVSAAVKTPEELEHVLLELKAVVQKTSASSKKLLNRDDDDDHGQCCLATELSSAE